MSSGGPLFQPFRALGYITEDVPFAVQRRGKATYVTVSVGRTWQVGSSLQQLLQHSSRQQPVWGLPAAWTYGVQLYGCVKYPSVLQSSPALAHRRACISIADHRCKQQCGCSCQDPPPAAGVALLIQNSHSMEQPICIHSRMRHARVTVIALVVHCTMVGRTAVGSTCNCPQRVRTHAPVTCLKLTLSGATPAGV